jgi:hypothetical protein
VSLGGDWANKQFKQDQLDRLATGITAIQQAACYSSHIRLCGIIVGAQASGAEQQGSRKADLLRP